jgi:hypothetical protein
MCLYVCIYIYIYINIYMYIHIYIYKDEIPWKSSEKYSAVTEEEVIEEDNNDLYDDSPGLSEMISLELW